MYESSLKLAAVCVVARLKRMGTAPTPVKAATAESKATERKAKRAIGNGS